eukprot:3665366-Alexandrium_andersonii.AAC.1
MPPLSASRFARWCNIMCASLSTQPSTGLPGPHPAEDTTKDMEGGGSAPTNFAEWAEAIARAGRWLDGLAVLAAARRVTR